MRKLYEAVTYGQITTEYRGPGFIAYTAAHRGVWEAGNTEAEAVGKLYMRLNTARQPVAVSMLYCCKCGMTLEPWEVKENDDHGVAQDSRRCYLCAFNDA